MCRQAGVLPEVAEAEVAEEAVFFPLVFVPRTSAGVRRPTPETCLPHHSHHQLLGGLDLDLGHFGGTTGLLQVWT